MKTVRWIVLFVMVAGLLLAGCQPQASQQEESSAADTPKVGGTLVWYLPNEPDSLDWHKAALMASYSVDFYLSAALMMPDENNIPQPYLAESYTVSDDGLVYEFKLRSGVRFHDGTPLTAQDYAWTFNRALAPETASPVAAGYLGPVSSVEAVDDLTLRITLTEPFAPLLFNLSDPGYTGPMPQAAVESMGDEAFARAPIGVGPYIFKEYVTGDHITLTRNPDYTWGPEVLGNTGPYYIETLQYRIIPEYSTMISGMEAGDLSYASILPKDKPTFVDAGNFTLFEQTFKGMGPYLTMNVSQPPFDDLKVRQAFNLAMDRQAMIDTLMLGQASIQYGPLSSSQMGYWAGASEVGYGFDLERAKALMQEAGYTYNADGKLEKDGQPFELTLTVCPIDDNSIKVAEISQQQLSELGVDVTIEQLDCGVVVQKIFEGDYQLCVISITAPEADILYFQFHSSGGLNLGHTNDPELDALLTQSRQTLDPAARQEVLNQIQRMIIEKAYTIPLYMPQSIYVLNGKVKGASMLFFDVLNLANAYIVE